MTTEPQLHCTLLRWQVKSRVSDLVGVQKFIPYHVDLLTRGDQKAREEFRYLQKWYTHALSLSMDEIRGYVDMVDIDELEGYTVEPITRAQESENNSNTTSEKQTPAAKGSPSQKEIEDLCQADEEIMTSMGFTTKEELEVYLNENVPTYSAPTITIPSDIQGTHRTQKDTDATKQYDDSGFYVGEDVDMEEEDDATNNHARTTSGFSWADDVEEAIEEGTLPSLGSSSGSDDSGSDGFASPDHTSSSSDYMDLDPSLRLRQLSSSPEYDLGDFPMSDDLRAILLDIGGNPDTKRSPDVTVLTADEFAFIKEDWDEIIDEVRCREATNMRAGPPTETPEEKAFLDSWDPINDQWYWQTEGLFMCRLTEIFYKEVFENARKAYLADEKRSTESKKESTVAPRRGSLLKNQIPP
ncbi:hypothetical protein HD806DRAFT_522029 [Xylariaceae sp. AK1471]|nr:hypothetical protein HD806DRAFT_522029 [Xylariaceae sp. AK1471]